MENSDWIWKGHRGGAPGSLPVCICCEAMKSAGHYGDCELAALTGKVKTLSEAFEPIAVEVNDCADGDAHWERLQAAIEALAS